VTRKVSAILKGMDRKVVVIRHPMPYGDLLRAAVQRFSSYQDLDEHRCTIEEREEYELHISEGNVVFAGVDYGAILARAEEEAEVILWDGGNNDLPFFAPNLHITLVDPHRAGHEVMYHPGEANLIMADVVLIPKEDTSSVDQITRVKESVKRINPEAVIIDAESPVEVSDPEMIKGKEVLVIEDGPTVTHGGMPFGAGYLAARKYGAGRVVDPRLHAVGSLKETFYRYPHLREVLPAMGYGEKQVGELQQTIHNTPCDLVIAGTPIDLRRLLSVQVPVVRATYEIVEKSKPDLKELCASALNSRKTFM
jgi:predicted GTPase